MTASPTPFFAKSAGALGQAEGQSATEHYAESASCSEVPSEEARLRAELDRLEVAAPLSARETAQYLETERRLLALAASGIASPLNACCYRDACKAMEARALAAEAALERAELVLCDLMNTAGHYRSTLSEDDRDALSSTINRAVEYFEAAAIRAQGGVRWASPLRK